MSTVVQRQFSEEKIVVSKNDTGTIGNIHTHFDPLLSLYKKNNKKWITDLNVKSKTIKLLEGNVGESLWVLGLGKDFLDTTSKGQFIKEQIDKLDSTRIKNICSSKRHC